MQYWRNCGQIINNHWAQVPTVLKLRDRWRIYYANRDTSNRSYICYVDVEIGNPKKIIEHKSESLLKFGKLGSFDQSGQMPTCVLQKDNLIYLYYIGWAQRKDVPYSNSIGLAISENGGQTFVKKFEGPVLNCSKDDPFFCGTINVLRENNDVWNGWYLSCTDWLEINKSIEPRYLIKYAKSIDGITWQPQNEAVRYKSTMESICGASVLKQNNIYKMWYCYRNLVDYRGGAGSYKIGYAESKDCQNWNRKDNKVYLYLQEWCSNMQCYPCVIENENKLYMFINGNNFGNNGFGFLILEE